MLGHPNHRKANDVHDPQSAAGIEAQQDFAATGILRCGCVICDRCRSANVLHGGDLNWQGAASTDNSRQDAPQFLIAAWPSLPPHIREAIVSLVDAVPLG